MDSSSIFSMIIFVAIIIVVILQPKVKLLGTQKRIQLDFGSAPLIGVAILLILKQADLSVLPVGILGTATIKPYIIIMLFFSLAYVCISIDLTGFFAYLSLLAAKKSGSSGKKLYFYFFLLSSALTAFTSNDIVILTLTPIIIYFCTYTKTNPIPFLIGQFFAANIWSMALYVGNPTNIIVAQAYNLDFLGYSMWMILPTVIAGLSCYYLTKKIFKKDIPENLTPPEIEPKSALKSKSGAIFGLAMLASCLVLLSLAPILHLNMGLICFTFAIILLIKDIIFDLRNPKNQETQQTLYKSSRLPTVKTAIKRMPWKIMPFIFGMFIMVEILDNAGWIGLFSESIGNVDSAIGIFGSVFFMCFLSSMACNIMNNQPMTILFTRVIQHSAFNSLVSPIVVKASMFALIMGSNLGANFTLIGALAGIMWSTISKEKGINITYKSFAKLGFKIMPIVVALASLILAIEFNLV